MKKLSFFLMAMLMSVMSFAAEATATISFANKAQRTVYTTSQQVWEQNGIVVTNDKANSTSNVGDYADPARFYKSSKVTIQCTLGNIKKIEISGCGANDKTTPWNTNGDAVVNGTSATITPTSTSDTYTIATLNGQARAGQMVVTYEVSDEGFVATPAIKGEQYFKESATVSMKAAEGLKVYYTLDGTEPTTASTEYAAPFEVTETTTVKAIAHDGENASEVVTVVFKKMEVLTPSEAVALCTTTESADKYIIRGYVTKIATAYDAGFNNITFWLADEADGGEILQAYRAVPVTENDKTVAEGAYVEIVGKLVLFGSSKTPEVPAGGTYTIIPAPVVNYTITVSANPAEAGTVTGDGEYEEGTEATLTATANEGYEFVSWTEGEEVVSTNAEYTFEVLADRNLVANFVEAAPEINYEEFIMSNLVVTTPAEGLEMLEASDPVNGISVMLGVYEDGTLHEDCLITFQGTELSIVSSEKVTKEYNEDVETDVYTVRVVVAFGGANMGLQLLMYATAAAEPIIINVEGATVTLTEYQISAEETAYELNMISNWVYEEDGLTYEVECLLPTFDPTKESGDYEASFFVRGEGNAFGMTEDAIVSVAKNGNQITLTGEITAYNNNVYNVTISGTLPVVEPTTITYELNGGELPTATVPTQDSLIAAFKDGYNAYFGVSVATTRVIDNFLYAGAAVNNPTCDVSLFMKDDASPWKWLGDYVLAVTNAQIEAGLLVTLKELATELMWRQSLTGFFLQQAKLDSNYKGNADFTEAGKPEAWGAAYQAAHAVVLPTEPVDAPYTLPTPTKEGYKFVGWYDNAAGAGDAYTVIPAGWSGTLYAIWEVEGPGTALENIAVEGKAVKAIINGQLIIIKNGVQYNAQGQVVK